MNRRIAVACLFSGLFLSQIVPSPAGDHLFTIGGGPGIESNQLSLENNVRYLQRAIEHLKLNGIHQKILFSDGGHPDADLQFEAKYDPENLRLLLAEFVGPSTGVEFNYRSSLLPFVDGAATPAKIEETLKQYSAQLTNGDRLLIYFTGHGGPAKTEGRPGGRGRRFGGDGFSREGRPAPEAVQANNTPSNPPQPAPILREGDRPQNAQNEDRRNPPEGGRPGGGRGPRHEGFANNILYLWNGADMSVADWTKNLDQLPGNVPVLAVMVQCYSGGFGNFIFKGGNPANGLAPQPRCGFFATVPDRVASGCTPKINEAEYREYSSYFFEALCGLSRTGQILNKPDYDQDGRTSFLEAHAYTVLVADTIDIPVRTSDIYLRQVSTMRGKPDLMTASSPITDLLARADACERAVINGLSRRFQLTGGDRAKEIDAAIETRRTEKQRLDSDVRRHRQAVSGIKREIGGAVKRRWPVISSPWSPETARIVTEEAAAVKDVILKHPRYAEIKKENAVIDDLSARSEAEELQIVKLERLKYWLETVALKANLATLDNPEEKQAAYHRIVALESTFLTTHDPVINAAR